MIKARRKLGLVFFPAFDWAISKAHPEREERLLYTQDQLFEEGIQDIDGIEFYNPTIASDKDIARVHFAVPDAASRLAQSHYIAAGGAIKAYQAVMEKAVDKCFALIRPPGHHAHRVVYGDRGFCIVNTGAVALERIRQDYGDLRVAIVDTDAHHGDGTQDIYWNDKDTLFISFHQDGRTLYPGTGNIEDLGGPSAYGYNINVPLPPGTGQEGFLYIIDNLVKPILDDFKPDIIINSAGQDNHYSDPLANMNFTAQGYAILNDRLNPDMAILEGGYSIESALPYVNLGIILAMAGLDYSKVIEPDYDAESLQQDEAITDYIKELTEVITSLWDNREALAKEKFKNTTQVTREQSIYYDTAGIMEHQVQTFTRCGSCPGIDTIDSRSDKDDHIFAITIPRKACRECIDSAHALYHGTDPSAYTNIYLQDRPGDEYLSR